MAILGLFLGLYWGVEGQQRSASLAMARIDNGRENGDCYSGGYIVFRVQG